MNVALIFPTLGILFGSSVIVLCDSKESSVIPRQTPVFSTNSYTDTGNLDTSPQHLTVFETLGNTRQNPTANDAYTTNQQQGKSSFGHSSFASADSSSGYSSSNYAPPAPPSQSYGPVGNRPTSTYPESRPTVVMQPHQPKPDETYAYYYQHYPASSHQYGAPSQSYGGGSGGLLDGDFFSSGSSLDPGEAGALGGVAGLGVLAIKGLAAVAKGALLVKPLLIFGLLLLLLLPLLILFLPIPIITIPTTPTVREGRARQLASAVTSLTQKVLGSEECLERILCKIPPVPTKFQGQARELWKKYGPKVAKFPRIANGLHAYFESTDMEKKHRAAKCNEQFKCSNKFF